MSSTRSALAPEVGRGDEATSSSTTTNLPTLETVACPPPTDIPADDKSTQLADTSDPADIIEMETLGQILDLDEEDNHEFSKGMAWAYFEQAAATFDDMDKAYEAKDLPKLSSLGHFLKGSSAALGVSKVQASCERVQHYGDLRDEELKKDLSPTEALAKINTTLARVKIEYAEAEKWLKSYYKRLEEGLSA